MRTTLTTLISLALVASAMAQAGGTQKKPPANPPKGAPAKSGPAKPTQGNPPAGSPQTQGNGNQGAGNANDPAAQQAADQKAREEAMRKLQEEQQKAIADAETKGVEVRIKDIARFRGIRPNQLVGYGLVIGLEGTGDSARLAITKNMVSNMLKTSGLNIDPSQLSLRNVAAVAVTAELPAFAMPGNQIDVTVQSMGDAKSLQGGFLIQTPLYPAGNKETAYAVAQGAVSIGGFNVSSGGNSVQKNAVNVGRIPAGAIVENMVETKFVFDGKMFVELDDADVTTAGRVAARLNEVDARHRASALNGGTIELTVPAGMSPIEAMGRIETTTVFADLPALVVINERTGTIVVGGNVKLGPAAVAHGALNVRIDSQVVISQPNSFSQGQTVVANQTGVGADETTAQIAMIPPSATVGDLARIFQTLKVTPRDIIAILQGLREQGALKARIKVQ